jgi:3-deoxy-7-phosphoheptulonate synthase
MIIVCKNGLPKEEIEKIIKEIEKRDLQAVPLYGTKRTVIAVIGDKRLEEIRFLENLRGVEKVMRVMAPYKLAAKEDHPGTTVEIKPGLEIGGNRVIIMAGPCSVEENGNQKEIIELVKSAGATIQRGGAFKPRTSPYAFQGLGEKGLQIMKDVREKLDMPIVTEVMDVRQVELVAKYADILQIGARNMQNFNLLNEVGKTHKPVLLKRGLSATIEEWLGAAEYILSQGNDKVILCERGIRTFETATRSTLDIGAIPVLREKTHLPIVIDPSHAAGKREYVPDLCKAAIAAGADGLIIEVHTDPEHALSDGRQTISTETFATLMPQLTKIAEAVGRTM